jgi:hypothetical protein
MPLNIRDGGVWKPVTAGSVMDAGTWKLPKRFHIFSHTEAFPNPLDPANPIPVHHWPVAANHYAPEEIPPAPGINSSVSDGIYTLTVSWPQISDQSSWDGSVALPPDYVLLSYTREVRIQYGGSSMIWKSEIPPHVPGGNFHSDTWLPNYTGTVYAYIRYVNEKGPGTWSAASAGVHVAPPSVQ